MQTASHKQSALLQDSPDSTATELKINYMHLTKCFGVQVVVCPTPRRPRSLVQRLTTWESFLSYYATRKRIFWSGEFSREFAELSSAAWYTLQRVGRECCPDLNSEKSWAKGTSVATQHGDFWAIPLVIGCRRSSDVDILCALVLALMTHVVLSPLLIPWYMPKWPTLSSPLGPPT